MKCAVCAHPAAPESNLCERAWACDVHASTLLCDRCQHPFWAHGAEHGPCYECDCKSWRPGEVAKKLCVGCGGALGPEDTGDRHADLSWCQEWLFWIECGNCKHPWDAHDLESLSCLGTDDLCKCTKWHPVAKEVRVDSDVAGDDRAPFTLKEIPHDDVEEAEHPHQPVRSAGNRRAAS